jgi:hypothetical protein
VFVRLSNPTRLQCTCGARVVCGINFYDQFARRRFPTTSPQSGCRGHLRASGKDAVFLSVRIGSGLKKKRQAGDRCGSTGLISGRGNQRRSDCVGERTRQSRPHRRANVMIRVTGENKALSAPIDGSWRSPQFDVDRADVVGGILSARPFPADASRAIARGPHFSSGQTSVRVGILRTAQLNE